MSYLVLARKWRPQQFADMLGQEHVTRTLSNALTSNRVAHAFLFTGARGVGKTSAARILAKALCCEKTGEVNAEPCGRCGACVEIAEGRATDVFEIDAASNTGVANVREIIDNVRYLPSRARFKIYIIDEVHMLSKGAFNALLKTLEEPPAHVKFILATTDVHQVPATILSRCQRYDFRRIPLGRLADRLSNILVAEQVDHDPSALFVVARESEGSMRDAQSLLEQVLTYASGRRLDAALVEEALGVADRQSVERVVDGITRRDVGAVLDVVRDIHERGLDLKKFVDALVEEVRDLLVARVAPRPAELVDRPADELAALVKRAQGLDSKGLERLFRQLADATTLVAESPYPRFAIEVHLASLAEEPPRVPVDALLDRLDELDRRLARGDAAPPPARNSPPSVAPGGATGPRPFPGAGSLTEPPRPLRGEDAGGARGPGAAPSPGPPGTSAPAQRSGPASIPEAAPSPPSNPSLATGSAPRAGVAPSPAVDAPLTRVPSPGDFAGWVVAVRQRRPMLGGSLVQVRPIRFDAGGVTLGVENAFDESKFTEPEVRAFLLAELAAHFGRTVELEVQRVARGTTEAPMSLSGQEDIARAERRRGKSEDARSRRAVLDALDALGAKIQRVKVVDDE